LAYFIIPFLLFLLRKKNLSFFNSNFTSHTKKNQPSSVNWKTIEHYNKMNIMNIINLKLRFFFNLIYTMFMVHWMAPATVTSIVCLCAIDWGLVVLVIRPVSTILTHQPLIHFFEMVAVLFGDRTRAALRVRTALAKMLSAREGGSEREGVDGAYTSEMSDGPIPVVVVKGTEFGAGSAELIPAPTVNDHTNVAQVV
jgi:hypothetical protein